MRCDKGFYPSFFTDQTMDARPHPGDWLMRSKRFGEAHLILVGEPRSPLLHQTEVHDIGDTVPFDYCEALAVDVMEFPDGIFKLQGGEVPESFDFCWNPMDQRAQGFSSLETFAAAWGREGKAVAVEFVKWTRGIPYRIDLDMADGMSPVAVRV